MVYHAEPQKKAEAPEANNVPDDDPNPPRSRDPYARVGDSPAGTDGGVRSQNDPQSGWYELVRISY